MHGGEPIVRHLHEDVAACSGCGFVPSGYTATFAGQYHALKSAQRKRFLVVNVERENMLNALRVLGAIKPNLPRP